MGMDNSDMKKTNAKIKSAWDYLNPANLKTLKVCNDIYQYAKECYDKGEYKKALGTTRNPGYLQFLKKNTADFDALIETGICYYEMAISKELRKNKTYNMAQSLRWLLQAQKLRDGSTLLRSRLFDVYAAKRDWKYALPYLQSLKGRLDPADIQKLRKKIPEGYKRNA